MHYVGPKCTLCDTKKHEIVDWILEAHDYKLPNGNRIERNRTIGAVLRCSNGHDWRHVHTQSFVA